MTDEFLKEETNTELIVSANGSSGIFRPCTHYQDEEILSNSEVENSSGMQIDKEYDSDGEADSDEPRPARNMVTVVINSDVFEFLKRTKS